MDVKVGGSYLTASKENRGVGKELSYKFLVPFSNASIKGWECNPSRLLVLGNKGMVWGFTLTWRYRKKQH